jgi:Cdc6-like AAA superfamily ATPase
LSFFVERKEKDELRNQVRYQCDKPEDVRFMRYFIVEGLSGVGKTETVKQTIKEEVVKAIDQRKLSHFETFYRLSVADENTTYSQTEGLSFLVEVLNNCHFHVKRMPSDSPETVLRQLLLKISLSEEAVWLLHLDEFQFAPTTVKSTLLAISKWNTIQGDFILKLFTNTHS